MQEANQKSVPASDCEDSRAGSAQGVRYVVPWNFNGEIEIEAPPGLPYEEVARIAQEQIQVALDNAAEKMKREQSMRIVDVRGRSWSQGGAVDVGDLHFHVEHIPEQNESVAIVSLTPDAEQADHKALQATLRVYVHPHRVFVMAPVPGTNREEHVSLITINDGRLTTYVWDSFGAQAAFGVTMDGVVSECH